MSSPIFSPATAPASSAGDASPVELTPTREAKAWNMFLADDSDKENDESPSRSTEKQYTGNSRAAPAASPLQNRSIATSPARISYSLTAAPLEDDSDSSTSPEPDNAGETAYARIKRQLEGASSRDNNASGPEPAVEVPAPVSDYETASAETMSSRKRKRTSPPATDVTPSRGDSPGLFLTPERSFEASTAGQDHDTDSNSENNNLTVAKERLQALVAQKRAERMEKERAVRAHDSSDSSGDANKPEPKKAKKARLVVESESDNDRDAATKLTQQARPTRKASKRAIEEINRETQRLSRNMQLTHEARTKVKYTPQDLFVKFGFRQPTEPTEVPIAASSSVTASSDIEQDQPSTPPSSPPSVRGDSAKSKEAHTLATVFDTRPNLSGHEDAGEDLASFEEVLAQSRSQPTKSLSEKSPARQLKILQNAERAKLGSQSTACVNIVPSVDSDDDLEIIKPKKLAVFDHLPPPEKRDSKSIQTLRALAHVNAHEDGKPNARKFMTSGQLQVSLRRRAREQALVEKAEKIQALRDKGIVIQTAEEKEKDQLEIESLVEKARKEAEELSKKEKAAAKKNGDVDESHLPDSEDEDEDWEGEDEDAEDQLSGSDDEKSMAEIEDEDEEEIAEEDDEADLASKDNPNLFDDEASEEGSDGDDEASDAEEDVLPLVKSKNTHRRKNVIVSDDEEDEQPDVVNTSPALPSAAKPSPINVDLFGFALAPAAPLGLTQVFAGTMSDSQTQAVDGDVQMESPRLPLSLPFPSPAFGPVVSSDAEDLIGGTQDKSIRELSFISNSQPQTPRVHTQVSDLPDPTQDMGFQMEMSGRIPPASNSTVATIPIIGTDGAEEVYVPQKRRLLRRSDRDNGLDEGQPAEDIAEDTDDDAADAFTIMRKASSKPAVVETFDKKRSEAKGMVEEQAAESEDEYAGLGGASDDESQGDADEDTKKMIDDESNEKVDEQQLAAYYADKERADDEKRVERLFKDINGGFRRKRGADIDFSDSDDDGAARRQAKQREFARMRRALLADEKLGKIAENPKQLAFLQAIEDRDDDDTLDLLEDTQESLQILPASEELSAAPSKGDLVQVSTNASSTTRPAAHLRRTKVVSKPSSVTQIRSVLSELLGESESPLDSQPLDESASATSDNDDASDLDDLLEADLPPSQTSPAKSQTTTMPPPPLPGFQPLSRRRTHPAAGQRTVIDRMALKRSNSNQTALHRSHSFNGSHAGKLAFQTPGLSRSNSGFKAPSLLRRATTSSTSSSTSSDARSMGSVTGGGDGKSTVKMAANKSRSSVNSYVREKERRSRIDEVNRRRVEDRERVGRLRKEGLKGGLGAMGVGVFME